VHLVLNEIIDQGHEGAEEQASQDLPVLDGSGIRRTERQAAQCPGQSCNQVGNHEDIMPIMIICGSNVCPPTARYRAEEPGTRHNLGKS
jgi:hypothetical protein